MSHQNHDDKDIAIIGMGCRWPDAEDGESFWQNIETGKTAFRSVPSDRWDHRAFYSASQRDIDKTWAPGGSFIDDIRSFDALHFGISPRQLEVMDPQFRLLLEATRAAIQDAGYETRSFDRERMGVFSGISTSEYKNVMVGRIRAMQLLSGFFGSAAGSQELRDAVIEMTNHLVPLRAFSMSGVLPNMAAATISQTFDFHGPSFAVDAACAAGSVAIQQAVLHLRTGLVDTAVAGGVYLNLTPDNLIAFTRVGAISASGSCRPFDRDADGFVQSDGVGMFLLKRLSDARRDGDEVRAVIKGIGCNNDGRGDGPMAPQVQGQLAVFRAAYQDAGVSPASISYFEAHGTGTAVGDPVEIQSLGRLLAEAGVDKSDARLVGSVKGNIGHAMSAAGVAGLVKAVKILEHEKAPPQAGFKAPHPSLEIEKWPVRIESSVSLLEKKGDHPLRVAASSFGFGGTNSHFVLEQAREPMTRFRGRRPTSAELPEAVIVSASTPALLGRHLREILEAITSARASHESLADIAYTLNAARKHKRYRAVLGARSKAELISELQTAALALEGADKDARFPLKLNAQSTLHDAGDGPTAPKVCFLFPGQGAQKLGLLEAVRARMSVFRETLDALETSCEEVTGRRLSSFLYPEVRDEAAERALTQTEICQPALAALGLSLARTLESLGVSADVSLGHSLGEFTALAHAGSIEPEKVVRLVAERGRAMRDLNLRDAGAMAAVATDRDAVKNAIVGIEGVVVANVNHPKQVSISGTTEAVQRASARLESQGYNVTPLAVSHAFHSPLLDGVRPTMEKLVSELTIATPRHVVASCIQSQPYTDDLEATRHTLREHATAPVEFARGLEQAQAAGATLFVQVGAGRMLAGFARSTLGESIHTLSLGSAENDGGLDFVVALATLSVLGVPVNFRKLHEGRDPHLVDLPLTPLDKQVYWAVRSDKQLLAEMSSPIPRSDEGFGLVDVATKSTSSPTTPPGSELVALFQQQNELLAAQAEILRNQTRALLGESVAPTAVTTPPVLARIEAALAEPEEVSAAQDTVIQPPAPEPDGFDLEATRERVLGVIAKVSAFPKSSLREGQKLVDELGFDSIMVADLGKSLESEFPTLGGLPQTLFSQRTTVGDLTSHVVRTLSCPPSEPVGLDEVVPKALTSHRVRAVPVPPVHLAGHDVSEEHWLLIEDDSALSTHVASDLAALGAKVYRIELTQNDIAVPEKLVAGSKQPWPVSKLAGLGKVLERSGVTLDGFVHLAPAALSGKSGFKNPLAALHPFAQILKPRRFATVTRLGGKLGLEKSEALTKNGSQAAILGYMKSLARERPKQLIKVIDIEPAAAPKENAESLVRELLSADAAVEVGLFQGQRFMAEFEADTLLLDPPQRSAVSAHDIVLISGGAGDLGAIAARGIASCHPKAIVLLGRRTIDAKIEGLLESLRSDGTSARYVAADVTDEASMRRAAEEISREVGNVTLAVHAAGLIEDAPVDKKSMESIQRVMNVKVLGLGSVLGMFPALETLVLFSSWAGRFGNASQADYAAANEIVDRVAVVGAGKTRVLSIDWPPWSSSEMVRTIPGPIQKAMKAGGVTFVDDEEGQAAFLGLLAQGAEGIHVIARELPRRETALVAEESISLESHPYLDHHRLKGRPIVPLASAADMLARAAMAAAGMENHPALTVEHLELLAGIDATEQVETVIEVGGRLGDPKERPLTATLLTRNGAELSPAYRASVRPALAAGSRKVEVRGAAEALPFDLESFYERHTFHGPLLRGIEHIEKMTATGIIGVVRTNAPSDWLQSADRGSWQLDPLAVDSSFQLAGYWAFSHHGKVGYPIGFQRFTRYTEFGSEPLRVHVQLERAQEDSFVGHIRYETLAGELVAVMEGVEGRFQETSMNAATETTSAQEGNGSGQAIPEESYLVGSFPEVEALEQRLQMAELIGLKNPYFPVHAGTARNRSVVEGQEMINYSSYNYLGFSGHPEVVEAAQKAIRDYGTSVSASRIASGERPIHRQLERGIADHVGVEDSIVLVSGHATNVTTIGTLFNNQDIILHDALIHDSILGGIKLSGAVRRPFAHQDYDALERTLSQVRGNFRRALIASEGIFSMDGDICDLPRLIELKKKYKCMLLIDEAHSIGVLGPDGNGIAHHFEGVDPNDVDIWMGTLSKSFASCGGYIAGREKLVRYLKYSAGGFVYSAGITPPNAAAAMKALEIMKRDPSVVARLRANSKLFLDLAKKRGIDTGLAVGAAVVPAIVGNSMDALKLSAALAKRKINVQPIVYPAVEDDAARLRFFISSTHTEEEIEHTIEVLGQEMDRIRGESVSSTSAAF